MSAEDVFKARLMRSKGQSATQSDKIKKMMANMGWTQGKGLGRQEQGILNPLVQKRGGGAIVESSIPNSALTGSKDDEEMKE